VTLSDFICKPANTSVAHHSDITSSSESFPESTHFAGVRIEESSVNSSILSSVLNSSLARKLDIDLGRTSS